MIKFALAAVAIAAGPAPAFAENGAWPIGRDQVHIVDDTLDARTATGRAALLARVERAAERLCRDVKLRVDQRDCVADTIRRTAAQTAATHSGRMLALAVREREAVRLAAR